jgi:uncharacterized delta-60 repeat protein
MVRLALPIAICAGLLAGAAQATGAERPGSVERKLATIAPGEDVQALAATPDHRILVAGRSAYGGFMFVRALLSDGSADPGFGSAGEVRLGSEVYDEVAVLAVQPDGRILVGRSRSSTLSRLNRDGSLDPSFGTGGSLDLDFRSGATFFLTVAVAADGRIVAASTPQNSPEVQVRRYLPTGTPDPTFGTHGQTAVVPPHPHFYSTLALQPGGRIVVVTDGGSAGFQIARLADDGTADPGFGSGGVAEVELGRRRWARVLHSPHGLEWRPAILPDGRIRIPVTFGPRNVVSRVGVLGLTVNGHVERRFGRQGLALGPRLAVSEGGEWPRVAVADANGSVLVAGSSASGDDLSGEDATIVRRFRVNGTPDLSFGHRGVMKGTLGSTGGAFEQQLAIFDGDTAVLSEEDWIPKYQSRSGGAISAVTAGYDRDDPSIAVRRACHSISVKITDVSGIQAVVVRAGHTVIRRTHRKHFRVRTPDGARRVSVTARDLAENVSTRRLRLPHC